MYITSDEPVEQEYRQCSNAESFDFFPGFAGVIVILQERASNLLDDLNRQATNP